MAIQNRRGAKKDFDATKMLPGELAVTTDGTRKVYVAFAPGDVKELASTEEVEEAIQSGIEEIEQKKEEVLAEFPDYEDKLAELETYKANSILSKSTGEVVTTTDSAKAKPKNIRLFGGSEQRRYEGYQLIDESMTQVFNNNNYLLGTVPALPNTEYTWSMGILSGDGNVHERDADGNNIATHNIHGATFTTLENCAFIYFQCAVTTDGTASFEKAKPMLNYGSVAQPYEPYVGGQPSPNINYPQQINHLGANGSIVGKILNTNMFNKDTSVIGGNPKLRFPYKTANFVWVETDIKVKKGDILYIYYSIDGVFNAKKTFYINDRISSSSGYLTKVIENKVTANFDGTLFVRLDINRHDGTEIVDDLIVSRVPMTEYQPYTEQPFTVLTQNGLHGIGNVTDVISLADGKRLERIHRKVLDGNAQIVRLDDDLAEHNTTRFVIQLDHKGLYSDVASALCTHASGKIMWVEDVEAFYVDGNNVVFRVNSAICGTTTESVRAWLQSECDKGTPVEIQYVLAEPIETPLTEEEIAQFKALCMNYPNTTVVNDAGAYMEVEYICDTQKHIEQNYVSKEAHNELEKRIAELEKAIVNS